MKLGAAFGVFVTFAVFAVSGCGGANPHVAAGSVSAQVALANSDVQALDDFDSSGARQVDEKFSGVFTAIFGGTTGARLHEFFNERVHYLLDPDTVRFTPNQFANQNWKRDPGATASSFLGTGKYQLAALNIGTMFWIEGLINRVSVFAIHDGGTIPINSSRVGVVVLGDGYKTSQRFKSGEEVLIPHGFRQALLMHEARHSDCTGGLSETELEVMRGLKDSDDFEHTFPTMPCGHLHHICHTGELAGIPACDSEHWGAYTVGSVYALAAMASAQSPIDQKILKDLYLDQMARVEADPQELLSGKLGKPNMTHREFGPK